MGATLLRRIAVPLDGSPEAESALDVAVQIARVQNAELVLVCVADNWAFGTFTSYDEIRAAIEDEQRRHPGSSFEQAARTVADATATYLADWQSRLDAEGLRVTTAQLHGPVSVQLLDWEASQLPDLVVMACHGRTGLTRFALGSVTDRIVREGTCPVLVVRRNGPGQNQLDRALVLLDGSEIAEQALPLVRALATGPVKRITLFQAVSADGEVVAARAYLVRVSDALVDTGAEVEVAVLVGEPRGAVGQVAAQHDLVVLCTHGRSGFDRWRHGKPCRLRGAPS
jgi:nucleotide-binding universal stress UspA family protein